jgi:hypothetical protein
VGVKGLRKYYFYAAGNREEVRKETNLAIPTKLRSPPRNKNRTLSNMNFRSAIPISTTMTLPIIPKVNSSEHSRIRMREYCIAFNLKGRFYPNENLSPVEILDSWKPVLGIEYSGTTRESGPGGYSVFS